MDIVVNGEKIGELIRRRTAEEYWNFCKIIKEWRECLNNSKNVFKTPIFEDENEKEDI